MTLRLVLLVMVVALFSLAHAVYRANAESCVYEVLPCVLFFIKIAMCSISDATRTMTVVLVSSV